MMKRPYKLLEDAGVLYPISKRIALAMWDWNTRESLDLCRIQGSAIYEFCDRDEIDRFDGDVYLYIGQLPDMIEERKKLFPSFESIVHYNNTFGTLPWGLRSIAKKNGWRDNSIGDDDIDFYSKKEGRRLVYSRKENIIKIL